MNIINIIKNKNRLMEKLYNACDKMPIALKKFTLLSCCRKGLLSGDNGTKAPGFLDDLIFAGFFRGLYPEELLV